MYRPFFTCGVLAGLAALANGCHDASNGSTPRLAADAAAEVAGNDGRVQTGDTVANSDGSILRPTDAGSFDSRVPDTADAAVSADIGIPSTIDAPTRDVSQGDAPALDGLSVSPRSDVSNDNQTAGEWLDETGVCRSNQIPSFLRTCQKTFRAAVTSGAPVGETKAGWCGNMLVWISYATPSIGCGYDSTGSTLVAQYYGDDVPGHCDRTSYGVSTPNWPLNCVPTSVDAGPDAR